MEARSESTSGVEDGVSVAVGIGVAPGTGERVATGTVVEEGTENKLQLTSATASIVIPRIHLLSMAVHLNWNIGTSVI